MTFVIPGKTKRFVVDNASMSLGNIYSTFNIMFDADVGRIKLNPHITKLYDEDTNSDFVSPIAIVLASADSSTYGSALDCYVLTTKFVWSTFVALTKAAGTNAPVNATDTTSDMCLFLGAQSTEKLYVSDVDGLHHVAPVNSLDDWDTLSETGSEYQNNFILIPFLEENRLYMIPSTADRVYSVEEVSAGSYQSATSGSYTLVGGLSGIRCARASSKTIWIASSGNGTVFNKSKIYEWDGVQTNPLNIHILDTDIIQSIAILNDIPYAIDGRGRLWAYDGYSFKIIDNLPQREDDRGVQTCQIHRNGMVVDKGKIYVIVGSMGDGVTTKNTTERALAGMWCYDPAIGLYHFDSPEDMSVISSVGPLSRHSTPTQFIMGYSGQIDGTGSKSKVSVSDSSSGLSTPVRTGYIITQFVESKYLTDTFNTIAVKFRQMIDPNAKIEMKYRIYKNIECNTTINWQTATTFTCSTADLAGTGTYFNTAVEIGDEVMIQKGSGVGTIAHVTNLIDNAGTTTVTIDRTAPVSSGSAFAMFTNFKLFQTIQNIDNRDFINIRLSKSSTMIQIKLVLSWRGYYDEIQEIQIPEQPQVVTS